MLNVLGWLYKEYRTHIVHHSEIIAGDCNNCSCYLFYATYLARHRVFMVQDKPSVRDFLSAMVVIEIYVYIVLVK